MPQINITEHGWNCGRKKESALNFLLDQKGINKFIIIILSYKESFVIIADSDFSVFRLYVGHLYI